MMPHRLQCVYPMPCATVVPLHSCTYESMFSVCTTKQCMIIMINVWHKHYRPGWQQHCPQWPGCPPGGSWHGSRENSMTWSSCEYPVKQKEALKVKRHYKCKTKQNTHTECVPKNNTHRQNTNRLAWDRRLLLSRLLHPSMNKAWIVTVEPVTRSNHESLISTALTTSPLSTQDK